MRRLAAILLALVPAAAHAASPAPAERLDDGLLAVYLRPFSPDAARLELRLDSLVAVAEDGAREPLVLHLRELRGSELTRQRRLATAALPAGRYAGLELRVLDAAVARPDGRAALLPPPEPVTVAVPFRVRKRGGVVLTLDLDYRAAVDSEFRLTPAFVGRPATRLPVAALGLLSAPAGDRLMLYDKVSGAVIHMLPTGPRPEGLALDEARRLAYVALGNDDSVIAVDLLEMGVLRSVRLRGGDQPRELALTPDGATLLAANFGSQTVSVLDPLAMVELDRIPVGDRPGAVVIGPTGARAFVANTAASSVTVVDIATRRVVATVATEPEPFRAQLDRTGERLFVVHRHSPYLTVIDTTTLAVERRVLVGSGVTALKVDPRTDLVYLGFSDGGVVEVYDPLSLLPVDSIPVAGGVSFLAIDGEENTLHVALPELGELHVVRLVGKQTVARADLGEPVYWVALAGER